jgi:histidine triad (HIT) family protein
MEYSGNDFYCDVALAGTVQLHKEYESQEVLAFQHTRPSFPVHIIVIPKRHISSFLTLTAEDNEIVLELVRVIKDIAAKVEKEQGAARILTNVGTYQDSKHLHFHVISGKEFEKSVWKSKEQK